jgi:hypothetical protein
MARNVVEILITAKNQTAAGFKAAKTQVSQFGQALTTVRGLIGTIGVAALATEFYQFAMQSRQASIELESARNKLAQTVGGLDAYNEAIRVAQEATRGMVSEVDLANGSFVLLEMGLAQNATEAAKLANAGNILAQAFESQGASVELFNRLLANGSAVLLDNFGISQAQVKIRTDQIAATQGLSEQEARLSAIRELAIEKSERLASTMTDEQVAAKQAEAAYKDMTAALGDLVQVAGDGTPVMTAFYNTISEGAQGWSSAIESIRTINQIEQRAIQITGLHSREAARLAGRIDEWDAAIQRAGAHLQAQSENEAKATAWMIQYKDAAIAANAATREAARAANEAAAARNAEAIATMYSSQAIAQNALANAQTMANQYATGNVYTDDPAFEMAQNLKEEFADIPETLTTSFDTIANDLSNRLSGAVGEAFGRMQQTVPGLDEMFGGGEEPGEFGRRLGALADGLQDSDQVFLEKFKEQAGGNPIYSALLTAIEEGDSAGVAAEANRLLNENLAMVIATGLKDSVVAQMREQEVLAEAQRILAEELGEPAGAAVTALEGVSTEAGTMKTKVDEATGAGVTGTNKWIARINELNRVLGNTNGLLEDVDSKMNKVAPVGDGTSIEQIGGMVE